MGESTDQLMDGIDAEHPVQSILARLREKADQEKVTTEELVTAFGTASFVPALMIPAILVVSPLSGIPLFSSFMGVTIALIAAQLVFGRETLWLPGWLMNRTVAGEKLGKAVDRIGGVAKWIDAHTRQRLRWLRSPPVTLLAEIACVICGAAMPFLEIVPFSSSILGAAVCSFAIGLLARDGLFILAGLAFMAVASVVPFFVWGQITG